MARSDKFLKAHLLLNNVHNHVKFSQLCNGNIQQHKLRESYAQEIIDGRLVGSLKTPYNINGQLNAVLDMLTVACCEVSATPQKNSLLHDLSISLAEFTST